MFWVLLLQDTGYNLTGKEFSGIWDGNLENT
jgi:hypothetical protein